MPQVEPAPCRAPKPLPPEEVTVYLPGGIPLVLVIIPAGSFQMGRYPGERGSSGGEDPQHPVTIAYDFGLGKTEVTQAQWEAVMGNPMPTFCGSYGVGPDHPAYCVSWKNVAGGGGFIEKLNQHLDETGQTGAGKVRLPSEAEWEYAARSGMATRYSFGDNLECDDACGECALAEQYMWWCGNNTVEGTKPVATKLPNPFGLFDMHGNLWEWVQDGYHPDYTGAPSDGSAWEEPDGSHRVIRGGTWALDALLGRSAKRGNGRPDDRSGYVGFRVAMSLEKCQLSCSPTATPSAGTAPLTVVFVAGVNATDCVGDPSFLWAFGDGESSIAMNPVHSYTAAGAHAWTLTVTADDQSCSVGGTVTVTLIPGDCDGDGSVSIGEVQKAINMFLGTLAPGCGVDWNGDGMVSIGEVQRVINGFLGVTSSP